MPEQLEMQMTRRRGSLMQSRQDHESQTLAAMVFQQDVLKRSSMTHKLLAVGCVTGLQMLGLRHTRFRDGCCD